MSKRKPPAKPADERQQFFQFFTKMADIVDTLGLEGGNQENLSEFEFRFRIALKGAVDAAGKRDNAPMDREAIAAEMTRILGRDITKSKIDQWTSWQTVRPTSSMAWSRSSSAHT